MEQANEGSNDMTLHLRLEGADASALVELHELFPSLKRPDLIRQLLRIGRSVVLSDPAALVVAPKPKRARKAAV